MTNSMLSHSHIAGSPPGKPDRGFTLVEMAIVLAIVALLLGSLLPTISSQIEQQHRNETRKQMNEIKEALIGFTLINGRLPCPADGTIATGQANSGLEATTGSGSAMTCTSVTSSAAWGVLPWAALGVSETDAWGRRFTYRVTATFADGADGTGCAGTIAAGVSFQLCSIGNLNVLTAATGGTNIAASIPTVIVSHGTNGLGAYTTTGQQLPGTTEDESENAENANNNFVSHDFSPTFDDLVIWISPNILASRMVTAGKLP